MMVRINHIQASSYKVMPWKNGGGSTTELLIHPPAASVQSGFDWRISLAQVPSSGPFSSFPDYVRTIVLLSGDPMRLIHQGHGEHLLEAYQPYEFAGAWQTTGLLSGRAVEDFNVMLRQGLGQVRVKVYRGSESKIFLHRSTPQLFILSWLGAATVQFAGKDYDLKERESLRIENGPELSLHLTSEASVLIVVDLPLQQR